MAYPRNCNIYQNYIHFAIFYLDFLVYFSERTICLKIRNTLK